jgi:hypothetical protein
MLAWPVRLVGGESAAGGPVRDEPGDGQVGLRVVLATSDPALQRPPLFGLGDGSSTQTRREDCCLRASS